MEEQRCGKKSEEVVRGLLWELLHSAKHAVAQLHDKSLNLSHEQMDKDGMRTHYLIAVYYNIPEPLGHYD